MSIGPLLFTAPLTLLALLGLPLLWWILRATPPQPQQAELPSLKLLDDTQHSEETPDDTPWWIILLRILALTLAILGLAGPIWSPPQQDTQLSQQGDILVLIDNGWESAQNWNEIRSSAENLIAEIDRDRGVYLLETAGRDSVEQLATRLASVTARSRLQAMQPNAWKPDYGELSTVIEELAPEVSDVYWVSSALKSDGFNDLAVALNDASLVTVFPQPANNLTAISGLSISSEGITVTLERSQDQNSQSISVLALDDRGRSVSAQSVDFERGTYQTKAQFDLPEDIQARIASFRLSGQQNAGAIWYWEGSSRTRRVGVLSVGTNSQPLLDETYYLRKALSPFSTLQEGNLNELLSADLQTIILTDTGKISGDEAQQLRNWVENGGVLIRFAGPRMAAQSDDLLPVRLRPASRAFETALSWDTPQKLAPFPKTGPFAAINVPDNVFIRRQILAQPDPELASRTWAQLEDGSPVLTSSTLGAGRLILFHVTATPDWSDLPLSGVFVDLLQRATLPARDIKNVDIGANTSLVPRFWLNGFGQAETPPATAKPLQIETLSQAFAHSEHPAGVYENGAVSLPINAGANWAADPVSNWPNGFTLASVSERSGVSLTGLLLSIALFMLLVDVLVSLLIAGKLSGLFRNITPASSALFMGMAFIACQSNLTAEAQSDIPDPALGLRFAYIKTGNRSLDQQTEAGLFGISNTLYRRTTVEPGKPIGLDLDDPNIHLFPAVFLILPDTGFDATQAEKNTLKEYLDNGGALIVDTRAGGSLAAGNQIDQRLQSFFEGLDAPPLARVPDDHVLTRSFYILQGFTGRYEDRPFWIEAPSADSSNNGSGDGISGIFVTDADLTAAWAMDRNGRPSFSVDGGERSREMAYRTGVNLIMYILTGNYKEDQVHLPSLLDRLGETTDQFRMPQQNRVRDILRPQGTPE